eukprot:8885-Heterococcus_DN1.PRE.2
MPGSQASPTCCAYSTVQCVVLSQCQQQCTHEYNKLKSSKAKSDTHPIAVAILLVSVGDSRAVVLEVKDVASGQTVALPRPELSATSACSCSTKLRNACLIIQDVTLSENAKERVEQMHQGVLGPCVVSDREHHSVGLRGCAQRQVGASGAVLEHNRAASKSLAEAGADACDLEAVGGHRSVRVRGLSARQSVLRAGQSCRHSSAIECSDLGDRQLIQHDGLGFDVHSAV